MVIWIFAARGVLGGSRLDGLKNQVDQKSIKQMYDFLTSDDEGVREKWAVPIEEALDNLDLSYMHWRYAFEGREEGLTVSYSVLSLLLRAIRGRAAEVTGYACS